MFLRHECELMTCRRCISDISDTEGIEEEDWSDTEYEYSPFEPIHIKEEETKYLSNDGKDPYSTVPCSEPLNFCVTRKDTALITTVRKSVRSITKISKITITISHTKKSLRNRILPIKICDA